MAFFVKVKGSFPGPHRWPNVPRRFHGLSFLHKHTFHFVAEIREGSPREIRFSVLAEQISHMFRVYLAQEPPSSCEELAEKLFEWLDDGCWHVLPGRVVSTEVNEDGGCGAIYRPGRETKRLSSFTTFDRIRGENIEVPSPEGEDTCSQE